MSDRYMRKFELAKAIAKASNNSTINSCEWDGLENHTQWRIIYVARLALKLEEDTR